MSNDQPVTRVSAELYTNGYLSPLKWRTNYEHLGVSSAGS
jgi:hypothetical protein